MILGNTRPQPLSPQKVVRESYTQNDRNIQVPHRMWRIIIWWFQMWLSTQMQRLLRWECSKEGASPGHAWCSKEWLWRHTLAINMQSAWVAARQSFHAIQAGVQKIHRIGTHKIAFLLKSLDLRQGLPALGGVIITCPNFCIQYMIITSHIT